MRLTCGFLFLPLCVIIVVVVVVILSHSAAESGSCCSLVVVVVSENFIRFFSFSFSFFNFSPFFILFSASPPCWQQAEF